MAGPLVKSRITRALDNDIEKADAGNLEVRTLLNGELRQCGSVSQMIFPIDVILRYISRVMTLEPGDLVATGTPAGVGPMQVGDTVEVVIDGIGILRNKVVGTG